MLSYQKAPVAYYKVCIEEFHLSANKCDANQNGKPSKQNWCFTFASKTYFKKSYFYFEGEQSPVRLRCAFHSFTVTCLPCKLQATMAIS